MKKISIIIILSIIIAVMAVFYYGGFRDKISNNQEIVDTIESNNIGECITDNDCVLFICGGCVPIGVAQSGYVEPPCDRNPNYTGCSCINSKCTELTSPR